MKKTIDDILAVRQFLLSSIQDLSPEVLNAIPPNFNNNIIWNLGHLVAVQQGICYQRAGLQPKIAEEYLAPYRPGTMPDGQATSSTIQTIKAYLMTSLEPLLEDYESGLFATYKPWTTRYGVTMNSIEDAMSFLLFHEGMHFGYVLALKRICTTL